MNLSRRQSLGLLAGAVITPTVVVGAGPLVAAATKMTPQERYDYHLAEMQKAAQELDPMIGHWHLSGPKRDDMHGENKSVVIYAFSVTGRYEGDGIYESGTERWDGKRTEYAVALLDYKIDGERCFRVSCPGDRLILVESRLETYIGRKIGGFVL